MTEQRLSAEPRRALELLADAGRNGASDATLLAYGFREAKRSLQPHREDGAQNIETE